MTSVISSFVAMAIDEEEEENGDNENENDERKSAVIVTMVQKA